MRECPARMKVAIGLAVAATALMALPVAATAATFTVTGFGDSVAACSGTSCPSLRSAITAANNAAGPDQIDLQAGSFQITIGSGEFGSSTPDDTNANGDLDVTSELTIRGAGAQSTVIQGALPANQGERNIDVHTPGKLTLIDLAVAGGRGGENEASGTGGGIRLEADTTLQRVVVRNNTVQGHASFGNGGGIATTGGHMSVSDSVIQNNTAFVGGYGGGIYRGQGSSELVNVTIAGNSAEHRGGGIESDSDSFGGVSFVTIVGNRVTVESSEGGGGIGTPDGLRVQNSIVTGNSGPVTKQNCSPTKSPQSLGGNVADAICAFNGPSDFGTLDPMLGALSGSPIAVMEPLPGSPALNRAVGTCQATDARGVVRPQGGGCDAGAAELPIDAVKPIGSALKFARRSFAAERKGASTSRKRKRARRGSKVAYNLSEAATVTFTVERVSKGRKVGKKCRKATRKNRKRRKCTLYKRVKGSFTHAGTTGANSFKFRGRMANKSLRRGKYRLVGMPQDAAGNVGEPFRAQFKIVKR